VFFNRRPRYLGSLKQSALARERVLEQRVQRCGVGLSEPESLIAVEA